MSSARASSRSIRPSARSTTSRRIMWRLSRKRLPPRSRWKSRRRRCGMLLLCFGLRRRLRQHQSRSLITRALALLIPMLYRREIKAGEAAALILLGDGIERIGLGENLRGVVFGVLTRLITKPCGAGIIPVATRVIGHAPHYLIAEIRHVDR